MPTPQPFITPARTSPAPTLRPGGPPAWRAASPPARRPPPPGAPPSPPPPQSPPSAGPPPHRSLTPPPPPPALAMIDSGALTATPPGCAFTAPSHFTSAFRHEFGHTPSSL